MRRLLEAALIALTLYLGAASAWALVAPPPEQARLMPATDGALTELAIQFHRVAAERFLPVYGELLGALDPSTRVHVVVADEVDAALFSEAYGGWFPEGGGPTLSFATTDRPITSWMRDRLAVLPDPEGATVLLAPSVPMMGPEARVHDWTVPWTLGSHLGGGVVVRQAAYRFDGGDLIADGSRAYVASPLFARNPDRDEVELMRLLEADLGGPVLALHDTPDHHLGMFVTPLGDGRVAVADPDLALAVLAEAGVDADELVVGGAPVGRIGRDERQRFAGVAAQLEAAGLEVVRLPTLPTTQTWAWLSYNNVLSEHRAGRLHVYLPVYGVDALDAAATKAWEAQGAVVHPIAVDGLFRLGGSVRCLVAPITRV